MTNFLQNLRKADLARDTEMTGGKKKFSLSFRGNELAGEVGEACNILKKLDREQLGIIGSKATPEQLLEELADIIICVDLIAMEFDFNLQIAISKKFNKTSSERNLKTFIDLNGEIL